jgi:hypothetical protein
MFNIHEVSSSMNRITENVKGYKKLLRESLIIILVINEKGEWAWKSFDYHMPEGTVKKYRYKTFQEYLKQWSRFSYDDLLSLYHDDAELLPLLNEADAGKHGKDERSPRDDKGRYLPPESDNVTLRNEDNSNHRGNSKAYTLRRLKDDFPEIYARVLVGELSANAAAIEAGFRKPSLSPLESLRSSWQKATPEERQQFLEYIKQNT